MLLIRDIIYCKPGQVRPIVDKFKAMNAIRQKTGMGHMRIMTDLCAERYWTVATEWEVKDLPDFQKMMADSMKNKELEQVMHGYHDHVVTGRREIYTIEV